MMIRRITRLCAVFLLQNSLGTLADHSYRPRSKFAKKVVKNNEAYKFIFAGAVAGIISRTVVSPLEVVSTINMATADSMKDPLQEVRNLWKEEGLSGLFKGNFANCLKAGPTKAIQFFTFEQFKHALLKSKIAGQPLFIHERLLAGGCSGVVAAACMYPLEVVKTLLMADSTKHSGVWRTLININKQGGMGALYCGLIPTVVAMFPYVGIEFCVYESLKSMLEYNSVVPLKVQLIIGTLAGAIAQTACHPLDVIRKRLQMQGISGRPVKYDNMIHAIMDIKRTEGIGSLYAGIGAACLSTLPGTGTSYVIYETCKTLLKIESA